MRRALEALIRFYETGEDADRVAYDIAWVEDQDSPVDTINGFIENYLDARGVKGAWEALVFYVNEEKTESLRRLADSAAWFESRMPWDPKWRRTDVVGVTARAIDVVVETGEAGPMTAIGINLPNDQQIREQYGSKSVTIANINEAYEKSQPQAYRREFCWSEDELARAERWGALASEVTTAIHEVLGHGSGRVAEHLEGQPQLALKEHYSAIEEARADLVALYFVPEPKIAEIGMLPAEHQTEIVQAEYEAYARNALVQLRRVREGTTIEEDHMRNRQMIVHWLMAQYLGDRRASARRQDVLRDGRRVGVSRGRRAAAGGSAAHQVRRRLRRRQGAVRDLRHAFRSGAARRDRHAASIASTCRRTRASFSRGSSRSSMSTGRITDVRDVVPAGSRAADARILRQARKHRDQYVGRAGFWRAKRLSAGCPYDTVPP